MARTLASTVIVRHPVTMRVEALRKGTPLPDWAEGLVADRNLIDEVDPRTVPAGMPEVASVGDGTGVDGAPPVAEPWNTESDDPPPERPHGNAGRDAWAAYAEALGLDVPADATKGDIKRLIGG